MKVEKQFIQCLVVHKPDEGYRLSHQIHQACEEAKTVAVFPSWDDAIQYLRVGGKADVILGSYELTDLHPSVFDKMDKFIPVVFTSAKPFVTEKAFALNCLDFINENCSDERLTKTFDKFKLLYPKAKAKTDQEKAVPADTSFPQKTRFLVKSGEQLFQKNQEDVAFFLAEGGQTYLVEMVSGEHFLVSDKLMDLEEQLDSTQFFRINRSIILNVKAIGAIKKHVNSRLKITPKVNYEDDIIVSREKVSKFKKWVSQ